MRLIEVAAIAVTSLMLLSPQPTLAAPPAQPAQPGQAGPAVTSAAATAASPAPTPGTPATAAPAEQGPSEPTAAAKPAEPPKPPAPSLFAKVNLTSQTMTVQVHGKAMHTWKVSSGASGYATPTGAFKPDWMSKMWYSKAYDDAPMPHSVFFKDGAAIHGTTSTGRLGTAASHGCVRLSLANAETFYKLVTRHGLTQTRIIVSGRAPVVEDRIARRDGPVRMQQPMRAPQMQVASRPPAFSYPGDRPGYPAGSVQVNRTPYWARY